MKKERIDEIFVLRAFAMLAVLFIHGTSLAVGTLQDSSLFPFYLFLNRFSTFTVPTFIFLSGFVLFYNYFPKEHNYKTVKDFYLKRIQYIVIPYFVFSVFYEFYYLYLLKIKTEKNTIDWFLTNWDFVSTHFLNKMFINGSTFYHLYFMFIIVQFYLLFPFFLSLLKKRNVAKFSIIIGIVLQWSFSILNAKYDWFPKPSIVFMNYISYFLTGGFFGIYYEQTKNWLTYKANKKIPLYIGWFLWFSIGCFYVFLFYFSFKFNYVFNSYLYSVTFFIFCSVSALVLFQISSFLYHKGPKWIVNLLVNFGAVSFAVYFIHPFFQSMFRTILDSDSKPIAFHFYLLSTFLLTFFSSWIVSNIISKYFPLSWMLFGSIPKQKPYK